MLSFADPLAVSERDVYRPGPVTPAPTSEAAGPSTALLAALFSAVGTRPWLPAVVRRLWELRELEHDWDGQGAEPTNPKALGAALWLVSDLPPYSPKPRISPTVEGGIHIEWFGPGMVLALDVEGRDAVTLFYREGESTWEGRLGEEPVRLERMLAAFPASSSA